MIKAVRGGGGRRQCGWSRMRHRFRMRCARARSEAQGAFGDPTLILERAIVDPRHIEVQVFGDHDTANAIHLGGARLLGASAGHQKLIEEAHLSGCGDRRGWRARMGQVAVNAVRVAALRGAPARWNSARSER